MLRSSRIRSYLVVSFASAILLCAFSLQVVQGADLSVIVNPSTGIDSLSCNSDPPCKTIAYAIHSRNASLVYLAAGYFIESSVINSSSPFVSITGLNGSSSTVFDCSRRSSSGPAFSIVNTTVSISGITFQNCANFNVLSGIGGAVSASGSSVTVSDCKFVNNAAQIGGAIGVRMSSLVVGSCVFENNTATCPSAASTTTACSAWGGAIGTEESPSVSIIGNKFNSNSVNLELNGVTNATSKAVGGGGCISVMHKGNVSESRVTIDGNALQSCSVRMFGINDGRLVRGIQFGSTYGGAVSLYYGLEAVESLVVRNARSAFVNNECRGSGIASKIGVVGNVYGGCLSVYVGAWNVNTQGESGVGSLTLSSMETNISGNIITNCNSASSFSSLNSRSVGGNVYGGGISVVVGSYSSSSGGSTVSGQTTVSNTSYTISSNTLTGCSATSSSIFGVSFGTNVYGGGISVAAGAYSYSSSSGSSTVSGQTTVSNTSYTISSNTLTGCSATSSIFGQFSNGANVYGGCISVAVGAYSYGGYIGTALGSTTVSNTSYTISSNTLTNCSVLSQTSSTSNGASSYGGALSLVHCTSSFPLNSARSFASAIGVSSVLRVHNCSFLQSNSTTSSGSCTSGASNAAGGAVFALVPSLDVDFFASAFSNATAYTTCAASSSSTYSLGGGVSIFQAGNVNVTSTNFTRCHAQGVRQSNNVFVSGGGIHIQAADSFLFQSGSITNCSIRDAFSTFLQSGGGAFSTQNVSNVQISDSIFCDNSDSSSSGSIVLQQFRDDCGMNVTINRSRVLIEPSITPALNISCGFNCSQSQQQRINIRFQNFNVSAHSETLSTQYESSAMMSLPTSSVVDSDRYSLLKCLFNFTNNGAIMITVTGGAFLTFSCAPCARSFEIAQTSRSLELSNFQNVTNLGQVCKATASIDLQQCPFGVPLCSTTVNISVGFWVSFSSDGKLGHATRCPRNYCGCNNIPNFNYSSCQLEPPFSRTFQPDVRTNDNLCNGNRTGVLCGGCKSGFTQSLDGYSCISNEECEKNVGWVWAVSIIGYFLYSLYIVISSLQASKLGLLKCVIFYGQMSSFAQFDPISASSQASESSSVFSWLSRVTQFESISSLSSKACYGTDIGAYGFTALQLYGPATVLIFAVLLALVLKGAQPFLQRHSISVEISTTATITNVILLIFSSLSTVIFKLITCSKIVIDNSTESVVFIDGSMKCYDEKWKGLIAVVVLLCVVPFLFAAALHFRRLPQNVQKVVCGAYSESRYYWGAVTLLFRLVMSIMFTTIRDTPSTAALLQCFLCVAMIMLLMHQKPYCHAATYFFDIFCHAILVVQFGLMAIGTVSDSLGLVPSNNNRYYETLNRAAEATLYLR